MRGIEALVEQQVRRWEMEERKRKHAPAPPNIAISRLPYSGASELAQRVAEQLGFGHFGLEIVDAIARSEGVQRDLVQGVDEHVRSVIDRFVFDTFRRHPFRESDYLRSIVRTIATIGERGGAVIVGRGSPFILPAERALRVFVVASRSSRVQRLAKREALDAREAERVLHREEHERREFLRHDFQADPDDPTLWDVMVRTDTLGIEGAADVVCEAFRRRFPAIDRRTASAGGKARS